MLDTIDLSADAERLRVERVLAKVNWHTFPGVQSLLLKGLTSTGNKK